MECCSGHALEAGVAGGKEGEGPKEEVIASPSVVEFFSSGTSLVLCVSVRLRENYYTEPPGMAGQARAWRRRQKRDLGNKMRQCISAPRSWYVLNLMCCHGVRLAVKLPCCFSNPVQAKKNGGGIKYNAE